MPLAEMVPRVEEPPAVPLTSQVTEVLELPETVAVKGVELPARMLAVVGETETAIVAGKSPLLPPPFEAELAPPPHPASMQARKMMVASECETVPALTEECIGLRHAERCAARNILR